jgi:hypothetical protein
MSNRKSWAVNPGNQIPFLCLAAVLAGLAQQPGPALSVDANAGRHAISPDIYGINFY